MDTLTEYLLDEGESSPPSLVAVSTPNLPSLSVSFTLLELLLAIISTSIILPDAS